MVGWGCLVSVVVLAAMSYVAYCHWHATVLPRIQEEIRRSETTPQPGTVAQPPAPAAQPSKALAVKAALEPIGEPDWVTKVTRASKDLRHMTVWVGPPDSEWVSELTMEWHPGAGRYEVAKSTRIPYP